MVSAKQEIIKENSTFRRILDFYAEYCNNSTVHGAQYLGDRSRPWYERVFWFIVICLSLYTCTTLTLQTLYKWWDKPVIVSLSEVSTPVWEIPFPTVTICPLIKAKTDMLNVTAALDNQGTKLYNASNIELERIAAFTQLCFPTKDLPPMNFSVTEAINELAPTIDEVFHEAKFKDKYALPWLREIFTEEGVCFNFNDLDITETFRNSDEYPFEFENITKSDWTLQDGYKENISGEAYPRRVFAGDLSESFSATLYTLNDNQNNVCNKRTQGYKIILSIPGEFPQVFKSFTYVPHNQMVMISIKPRMIITAPVLRSYNAKSRYCYFEDEKYLRFFKMYTENNCQLECLTNRTLEVCDCAMFFMPRNNTVRVCDQHETFCYADVEKWIYETKYMTKSCECLPSCTSISYDAELTQSPLNIKSLLEQFNMTADADDERISMIRIFFSNNQFLSSKRSEIYGLTDFIANCGGIFGLFMGVSILSVVEIVYFFTIRLHANLKLKEASKEKI